MTQPPETEPDSPAGEVAGGSAAGLPAPTLLDSPLDKTLAIRFFVIGGPIGLAIALLVGLWVAQLHVRHSVVVQVDETWAPGQQVAMRSQLIDGDLHGVEGVSVVVSLADADGKIFDLGGLNTVPRGGVSHGTFRVPEAATGTGELVLRYTAPSITPLEERVALTISASAPGRKPAHTISTSSLQWGDDTDPQPEGMRIAVRPAGRLLAGFSNRLLIRVTHVEGRPWSGPVDVRLVDGEFMGIRGKPSDPPRLVLGSTDSLGLIGLQGPLASEVLRLEVRVLGREDNRVEYTRRFRFVSYPGAVQVDVAPLAVEGKETVEVHARGLSLKRPVFVDVYDAQGAWVDTFQPPMMGAKPPREWVHPGVGPGMVQFEAYYFTNSPGESTAIARLHVGDADPLTPESLDPLIAMQRAQLETPRVERDFDAAHERKYLEVMDEAKLAADEVKVARAWLVGTLPVTVYGPPLALTTRPRLDAALVARKGAWKIGLRWFLLGGGGLFLLAMLITMVVSHAQAARTTLSELQSMSDEDARPVIEQHVRQERRSALLRGLGVMAVMAGGLVLTLMMLENLL